MVVVESIFETIIVNDSCGAMSIYASGTYELCELPFAASYNTSVETSRNQTCTITPWFGVISSTTFLYISCISINLILLRENLNGDNIEII